MGILIITLGATRKVQVILFRVISIPTYYLTHLWTLRFSNSMKNLAN